MALAPYGPQVLHEGVETGGLLEGGLRTLFKMFEEGVECTELNVKPLGGALFGSAATPILSNLRWGERAVAHLLDQLLWTTPKRKAGARQRVHYGPLDVEDLGRVYEALLELEPGITGEPMCRLRRQKLEVVVPVAQGEKYRPKQQRQATNGKDIGGGNSLPPEEEEQTDEPEEDEAPKRGKKTTVQWIEEIPPDKFYLRVGLGRKASGSYYTPHSFVRFLVQETLGPQVAERSPHDDPKPGEILKLKVLDPAMGSGHFLVEACRFLGGHLYEAARLCDEKATELEREAEKAKRKPDREKLLAEAREYRQRVIDLPDPDDELVLYLPSRSVEGEESGVSQHRAEALCRRMVAVHCLYGVDKNPLAVELAKLALWLESHAEGMPLTFLDHRLVVGDSLTGPFWDKLIMRPSDPKEPIEGIFHQGLTLALQNKLAEALSVVRHLEATVGVSLSEIEEKERLKAELDQALRPFRIIASAWSGGVMLGPEKSDDLAYADLLKSVAETGEIPKRIESERLRTMIARGLALDDVPEGHIAFYELLTSGRSVPALPYDLAFPEVFYPTGVPHGRRGFHAVLGNPPWDAIQFKSKEFLASYDISILDATTKREAGSIERQILSDGVTGERFEQYKEQFEDFKRANDVLYEFQKVSIDGQYAGRQLDAFRVFMERMYQLLTRPGFVGVVVPAGFHANDGAIGVRHLLLEKSGPVCCYSFINRRKHFEIGSGQSYDLVVTSSEPTPADSSFATQFQLENDEWLFGETRSPCVIPYQKKLLGLLGGDYLSLVEFRNAEDALVCERLFSKTRCGREMERLQIQFNSCPHVMHMSHDSFRFVPTDEVLSGRSDPRIQPILHDVIASGYTPLHEKGTIEQYDECHQDRPRYCVDLATMQDRRQVVANAQHYRLCHRRKIHAGEHRKVVVTLLTPGGVSSDGNNIETNTSNRRLCDALVLMAVMNSFLADFVGHRVIVLNLGMSILKRLPFPRLLPSSERILAHDSLRLTCNHTGYEPLWREQVGDAWREAGKKPFTWPVLAGDDERWEVRAAIDAVVADAYALSRDQYEHVLSTFSHKSYPKAPELCLAKFDELKPLGLDAFTRKHDPYHDIPLNENLPEPVIDLPIPEENKGKQGKLF